MFVRRNRSSRTANCARNCPSASPAEAVTNASIAGCTVRSGPLTSIAPSSAPVSGSCNGAAAQVQVWYVRTRCSAE